jgi:hypothetical protein
MAHKRINIEGENNIYFVVDITLNILKINVVQRGYDGKSIMERKYFIKSDVEWEKPKELNQEVNLDLLNIPLIIHNIYKEYLELKNVENKAFEQIKDAKTLEFGEVVEGEEDYLP